MKREELLRKMIACFNTCTLNLHFPTDVAIDRVLEIVEENFPIAFDNEDIDYTTEKEYNRYGYPDDDKDPDDDDDNCGAV